MQEYQPEECPYETVIIDVTHRCNMTCRNCYIPNRSIPDLDLDWLTEIFSRLPRGTRIRLAGAEATLRKDLAEMIQRARRHRQHVFLLTNGLKLASRSYVRELKEAGLRLVYLSFNGGLNDEAYEIMDGMNCRDAKIAALENLCAENMYVVLGMIVVRGVNEHLPREVLEHAMARRQIREFHLRSIGQFGRYMHNPPLSMNELAEVFSRNAGTSVKDLIARIPEGTTSFDFPFNQRLTVHLTQWPDLNSPRRGRLTPEGTIQPFFEHVIANEGGY